MPLRPTTAEAMTEHAQISTRSMHVNDQIQGFSAFSNLAGLVHAAACWTTFRRCWAADGLCGLEPTADLARCISALHCRQPDSRMTNTTHAHATSDHRSAMATDDRHQLFTHSRRSTSSIFPQPKTFTRQTDHAHTTSARLRRGPWLACTRARTTGIWIISPVNKTRGLVIYVLSIIKNNSRYVDSLLRQCRNARKTCNQFCAYITEKWQNCT